MSGILAITYIGFSFYDRQFKLANIQGTWPIAESSSIANEKQLLLQKVFSQPFQYLDRGKQSYVFISQDQRYVLKFFDNRCLRSGMLPFFFSIKEKQCAKKLSRLFRGYQTAITMDMNQTGLLFVQLVPDKSYKLDVNVTDRFNIHHEINLAEVPFVLQEKAVQLRELITSLLNEGNVTEAESRLHQIIDMYVDGYKKGILDLDHNFMYNTGFVDDRPIRIDLGRLKISEKIKDPNVYQQDLNKVFIKRLDQWLKRHFPNYRQEILENIQKKLEKV